MQQLDQDTLERAYRELDAPHPPARKMRGTTEEDFLRAEIANLEAEAKAYKREIEHLRWKADHFETLYRQEQEDRAYWYKCYTEELGKVK